MTMCSVANSVFQGPNRKLNTNEKPITRFVKSIFHKTGSLMQYSN